MRARRKRPSRNHFGNRSRHMQRRLITRPPNSPRSFETCHSARTPTHHSRSPSARAHATLSRSLSAITPATLSRSHHREHTAKILMPRSTSKVMSSTKSPGDRQRLRCTSMAPELHRQRPPCPMARPTHSEDTRPLHLCSLTHIP